MLSVTPPNPYTYSAKIIWVYSSFRQNLWKKSRLPFCAKRRWKEASTTHALILAYVTFSFTSQLANLSFSYNSLMTTVWEAKCVRLPSTAATQHGLTTNDKLYLSPLLAVSSKIYAALRRFDDFNDTVRIRSFTTECDLALPCWGGSTKFSRWNIEHPRAPKMLQVRAKRMCKRLLFFSFQKRSGN